MANEMALLEWLSSAQSALAFFVDLAFLVLVLTVVRRAQPQGWILLATALAVLLVVHVLGLACLLLLPIFARGATDEFLRANLVARVAIGVIALVARVLMVAGVVRLARLGAVQPSD